MKILMCHDGSEQTDKGLQFGCVIARACGAEVTLLGITEPGGLDSGALLAHLQHTREALEHEGVRTELISRSGVPVQEILGHGDKESYDLVVIGGGSPGAGMPATTYELVRRIGPPVLLVVGERTELKKILLCTGGKSHIEQTIAAVGGILRSSGAAVTVLHVLPSAPLLYSNLIANEDDPDVLLASGSELGRNLARQKAMIEALSAKAEIRLRHGFVQDEVITEAQEGDYDLIVVGSWISRGPLYRYMLGDVTREIVTRAPCPVLVSRQREASGGTGLMRRLFQRLLSIFARPAK